MNKGEISVNVRYSIIIKLLAMTAVIILYKIFGHRQNTQRDNRTSLEVTFYFKL